MLYIFVLTLFPFGSHRRLRPSFFFGMLSSKLENSHFVFLDTLKFWMVSLLLLSTYDLVSLIFYSSSSSSS